MKIWALSDLHLSNACDKPMDIFGDNWSDYQSKIKENWQKKVGKNDIVLVAGDISWALKLEEAVPDLEWLSELNGTKIIIKGNHELWWQSLAKVKQVLPKNIIALQNNSVKIGNVIFCGTRGWQVSEHNKPLPKEDQKIYDREVIRLGLTLADMEKQRQDGDKVICLFHYPPFNYNKDDNEFTAQFKEHKVDAVVFGHLHGKQVNMPLVQEKDGITYYLTATYQVGHITVKINF